MDNSQFAPSDVIVLQVAAAADTAPALAASPLDSGKRAGRRSSDLAMSSDNKVCLCLFRSPQGLFLCRTPRYLQSKLCRLLKLLERVQQRERAREREMMGCTTHVCQEDNVWGRWGEVAGLVVLVRRSAVGRLYPPRSRVDFIFCFFGVSWNEPQQQTRKKFTDHQVKSRKRARNGPHPHRGSCFFGRPS